MAQYTHEALRSRIASEGGVIEAVRSGVPTADIEDRVLQELWGRMRTAVTTADLIEADIYKHLSGGYGCGIGTALHDEQTLLPFGSF